MGVFEQVLPKTIVPNHSMLGSYHISIDPLPCLEYTRAYARANGTLKKCQNQKNRSSSDKKIPFFQKTHMGGF